MGLIVDEHNQNKGLVLEYCSGGPLNTWLKKNQNVLSLKNSIDWALQVANGMEYLHKWVFGDLYERIFFEILLNFFWKFSKISDF